MKKVILMLMLFAPLATFAQKFGHVDGTLDKEMKDESYVPGSYIKGSLRDGHYQKSVRAGNKAQSIIGLVGLMLVVGVLFYILKFYSLL